MFLSAELEQRLSAYVCEVQVETRLYHIDRELMTSNGPRIWLIDRTATDE